MFVSSTASFLSCMQYFLSRSMVNKSSKTEKKLQLLTKLMCLSGRQSRPWIRSILLFLRLRYSSRRQFDSPLISVISLSIANNKQRKWHWFLWDEDWCLKLLSMVTVKTTPCKRHLVKNSDHLFVHSCMAVIYLDQAYIKEAKGA